MILYNQLPNILGTINSWLFQVKRSILHFSASRSVLYYFGYKNGGGRLLQSPCQSQAKWEPILSFVSFISSQHAIMLRNHELPLIIPLSIAKHLMVFLLCLEMASMKIASIIIKQSRLEQTFKDHLIQLFLGKGAFMRLPSILSNHILKIFSDGTLPHLWVVPVNDCSHCKKFFSYIEMKLLLVQLVSIVPCLLHMAPCEDSLLNVMSLLFSLFPHRTGSP